MSNISLNNSIVGKQFISLSHCHSTNDVAHEKIKEGKAKDGMVIHTDHQLSGRGQRGNQWQSNPSENLTASIILQPQRVLPSQQFVISMCVALGISNFLNSVLPRETKIKWPNDIMVGDKKICGILIENTLKGTSIDYSVVGIGINVNQEEFYVPTATSIFIEKETKTDVEEHLGRLCYALDNKYKDLLKGDFEGIQNEYISRLYRYDSVQKYKVENRIFHGRIVDVSLAGQLSVESGGEVTQYNFKEIEYIYD